MSLAEPLATTGSNRVVQHPYKNQKAKTAQCTEVEILLPILKFGLVFSRNLRLSYHKDLNSESLAKVMKPRYLCSFTYHRQNLF